MNKIFKSKWNVNTQSYVACSELTKRASKTAVGASIVAAALAALSPSAYAVDCVAQPNGTYNVGWGGADTRCDTIPDSTVTINSAYPWFVLTRTDLRTTLNIGNVNYTVGDRGMGPVIIGNQYALGSNGARINVGNVTANMQGKEGPDGIASHSGVDITAKDVNITSTAAYEGGNSSGSVASYGLLAGSSNDSGEQDANLNGTFTTITVNNFTLDQTTAGGRTFPILNSGLRAIQSGSYNSGKGTSGKIIINDQLNMHLKGERIEGVYASGSATNANSGVKAISTIQLNNSNIIAETTSGGREVESGVIKVGKARAIGTGEGLVESKGTLNIDSSNLKGGTGIKLYNSNSEFKADFDNSATNMLVYGSAIEISPEDWQEVGAKEADGIKVSLKNANLNSANTGANAASLLKVYENQKNAQINISGDDSILTAAKDGWLLEVGAVSTSTVNVFGIPFTNTSQSTTSGNTTANFTSGKYFGLTTLSDSTRANPSSLNINLDGANTKWYLANKGAENKATFTTLNIANGATVDATGVFAPASKTVNLFNGKTMTVADSANIIETALTEDKTFVLKGAVNNNGGILNLVNTEAVDMPAFINTLQIDGNYAASGDSKVNLNTGWNAPGDSNGANSKSDVLHITGTATGTTKVVAVGKNNQQAFISGSIQQLIGAVANTVPVVRVDGAAAADAFTGTAQTTGAGEAQLATRMNGNTREFFWTITALNQPPVTPPVMPPVTPPVNPGTPIVIYSPTVPAYAQNPKANLELGFTTLATLHERRGENQVLAWDDCGTCGEKAEGQTWVRAFGKHLELDGKTRLGMKSDIFGIQIGHDFAVQRTDEGGHRLTGAYLSYANMKSTFTDRYRTLNGIIQSDKHTGTSKTANFNLGITHTRYAPNGAYVDLVGQIGTLSTKFNARNGTQATQKGNNLLVSAEIGRPYALFEHKANEGVWFVEPQAQLSYQFLKLSDFTDGIRTVHAGNHHGLRARLGVRLAYNTQAAEDKYRTNTFYAIANVLQDLNGNKGVRIGMDNIKETYAKTWAELGLGGQLPLGKASYVYADARYERNLGGAAREGYRASLGYKYTWK